VLDPFCGCGTTVHAAQKLGRNWIGIDITHLAIGLIEKRLNDAFENVQYTVHGTPMDAEAARDLFDRDDKSKKQFETWAVLRIGFIPQEKKGADGGLDGVEWFGPKKEYKAIISVKGGRSVGVDMLRSLDAVITAQGAQVGVILTLEKPTSKMIDWARQAGMFEAPGFPPVPRLQIVTVEQAIAGRARAVNLPARHNDTFRRAPREEDKGRQGALDL
jgi:site-specific DNA-methyltransferase (adenine-specific)